MQVMIKNRHTDEIKYVSEQTAEMIQNEDWLKKNWEIVERDTPPYEVVQFQELKKNEDNVIDVVPEKVEEITWPTGNSDVIETKDKPEPRDVSKLTVRQVEAEIDSFTTDEMAILADDPRVSVRNLIAKKLKS